MWCSRKGQEAKGEAFYGSLTIKIHGHRIVSLNTTTRHRGIGLDCALRN